jgi:hypothetical protein
VRDKRYVLTRRRSGRFEHVHPEGFKRFDAIERRWERQNRPSFLRDTLFPFAIPSLAVLVLGVLIIVHIVIARRPPPEPEPTSYQLARAAAARERAAAFVRALGFEPGPAVCRAKRDGPAWCTIRVAKSDKTFALWCSRRHPTCIENLPRE